MIVTGLSYGVIYLLSKCSAHSTFKLCSSMVGEKKIAVKMSNELKVEIRENKPTLRLEKRMRCVATD